MKQVHILFLLFLGLTTSSFQCDKCFEGDRRLDKSRSWLPLKGKTILSFISENNQPADFDLHVIDTLQTYSNAECSSLYRVEYIQATLYLNARRIDSIFLQLASPSALHVRAVTDTSYNIGVSGFLIQSRKNDGAFKNRFYNFSIGSRKYDEVLLIKHGEGYNDAIDSLFLANNVGIVGFKYLGKKYSLQ
jgi:hypothetical protein